MTVMVIAAMISIEMISVKDKLRLNMFNYKRLSHC